MKSHSSFLSSFTYRLSFCRPSSSPTSSYHHLSFVVAFIVSIAFAASISYLLRLRRSSEVVRRSRR